MFSLSFTITHYTIIIVQEHLFDQTLSALFTQITVINISSAWVAVEVLQLASLYELMVENKI